MHLKVIEEGNVVLMVSIFFRSHNVFFIFEKTRHMITTKLHATKHHWDGDFCQQTMIFSNDKTSGLLIQAFIIVPVQRYVSAL